MRALVIGSGGREHALVKKLAESSLVESIWCYPGNAGIADIAKIPLYLLYGSCAKLCQ